MDAFDMPPAPPPPAPRPISEEELRTRFTYHAPKPEQISKYDALRYEAWLLASMIVDLTPPSREQSEALTHLETAVMFANAAIARRS